MYCATLVHNALFGAYRYKLPALQWLYSSTAIAGACVKLWLVVGVCLRLNRLSDNNPCACCVQLKGSIHEK